MAVYKTHERIVTAEQFTEEMANAYIAWHVDNANDADEDKQATVRPELPKGVTYSEHTGFELDVPGQPAKRLVLNSYIVREGRDVRIEGQAAFESVFHPKPVEAIAPAFVPVVEPEPPTPPTPPTPAFTPPTAPAVPAPRRTRNQANQPSVQAPTDQDDQEPKP